MADVFFSRLEVTKLYFLRLELYETSWAYEVSNVWRPGRVGGNGETARNGLDTKRKISWISDGISQKKEKHGGKVYKMFFVEFFLGEEDLSNFAGEMLLCCYDRILIQISKFLSFCGGRWGDGWYIPFSRLKLHFQIWGVLIGAQKNAQTVC